MIQVCLDKSNGTVANKVAGFQRIQVMKALAKSKPNPVIRNCVRNRKKLGYSGPNYWDMPVTAIRGKHSEAQWQTISGKQWWRCFREKTWWKSRLVQFLAQCLYSLNTFGMLAVCTSASVFKFNKLFFGCFYPEFSILDNENKYFLGWPNRYFG